MSIANLQNNIPVCQRLIYNVSMRNYDADAFAEWLRSAYKDSPFKSYAALADKAELTRATVSSLINSREQSLTGKAGQPKPETVAALAKALNKDIDEALLLAGHAPIKDIAIIRNKIKVSDFDGFNDKDIDEIAEYIAFKKSQKNK